MSLGDNEDYIFMYMSALGTYMLVLGHDNGHHVSEVCMRHTSPIRSPPICLLLPALLFLIKIHFCFCLNTGIAIFLFGRPPFVKAILIHVCHSRQRTRRVERSMTTPDCAALC